MPSMAGSERMDLQQNILQGVNYMLPINLTTSRCGMWQINFFFREVGGLGID